MVISYYSPIKLHILQYTSSNINSCVMIEKMIHDVWDLTSVFNEIKTLM